MGSLIQNLKKIIYKTRSEATNAIEKHDKELFDGHLAGERGQTRHQLDPPENVTVICNMSDPEAHIDNVALFKSFGEFGEIREINIVSKRKTAVIRSSDHVSARAAIEHRHAEYTCSWSHNERSSNVPINRRLVGNGARRPSSHAKSMKHTSTYEVIGEYNRNESSTQSNYRNTIHPSQSKKHDNASVSDRLFRIAGYNRRRDAPPQGDNSSQSDSQSSKVKNRGGYRQNSPNQRARSKSGIETFRTRRWNRLNNENTMYLIFLAKETRSVV